MSLQENCPHGAKCESCPLSSDEAPVHPELSRKSLIHSYDYLRLVPQWFSELLTNNDNRYCLMENRGDLKGVGFRRTRTHTFHTKSSISSRPLYGRASFWAISFYDCPKIWVLDGEWDKSSRPLLPVASVPIFVLMDSSGAVKVFPYTYRLPLRAAEHSTPWLTDFVNTCSAMRDSRYCHQFFRREIEFWCSSPFHSKEPCLSSI